MNKFYSYFCRCLELFNPISFLEILLLNIIQVYTNYFTKIQYINSFQTIINFYLRFTNTTYTSRLTCNKRTFSRNHGHVMLKNSCFANYNICWLHQIGIPYLNSFIHAACSENPCIKRIPLYTLNAVFMCSIVFGDLVERFTCIVSFSGKII